MFPVRQLEGGGVGQECRIEQVSLNMHARHDSLQLSHRNGSFRSGSNVMFIHCNV